MKQPSGFSFNDEASKPVHTGESFYKKRTEDNATDQTQVLPDWPDPGHEIVIDDPEAIARIKGAIREETRDGRTVLVVRDEVLTDAIDEADPDFDPNDTAEADGMDFAGPLPSDGSTLWGDADWEDADASKAAMFDVVSLLLPDMWALVESLAGSTDGDPDLSAVLSARAFSIAAGIVREIMGAMVLGKLDVHLRDEHGPEERRAWRKDAVRVLGNVTWDGVVSSHPDLDAFRKAFTEFNKGGCTTAFDVPVFDGLSVHIEPTDGEGGFSPTLEIADPDDAEDGAD